MTDWRLFFATEDGRRPQTRFPAHKSRHDNLEAAEAEGERVLHQLRERNNLRPWVANIHHGPVDVGAQDPDWSFRIRRLDRDGWHRR